jgi:hypothetical protein
MDDYDSLDRVNGKATFQSIKIVQRRDKSLAAVVWPPPYDESGRGLRPPQEALVSISHEGEYATAMCLACKHPDEQEEQGRTGKVERTQDGDMLGRKIHGRSSSWTDQAKGGLREGGGGRGTE